MKTIDRTERLLPCPFCGSDDVDSHFGLSSDGMFQTGCMRCGAATDFYRTEKQGVIAWNTRK